MRVTEEQYAKLARGEKITPTEHAEQVEFFKWWRKYAAHHGIPECICFAIPNASAQYLTDAGRIYRWAEGMTAGVLDIFLAAGRGPYNGLFIEMKRQPNDLTDAQRTFKMAVEVEGYLASVAWNAVEATKIASDYLDLKA